MTGPTAPAYTVALMTADRGRGEAWAGMGDGWAITSTFVAAIGLWGGLGFLADHWLGSKPLFFVIGMVVGAAAGTYIVWLRYGRGERGGSGT